MKYFFTALSCFLLLLANGQMLDSETTVFDKIQGEALFKINGGEYVYSFMPEGGWYKIRKEVYVDPVQVVDDKYIVQNAILRNEEGEQIGLTLAEVKMKEMVREKEFRSAEKIRAIVEGYVFKTKLEDMSRPEDKIAELLANKSRTLQISGFQDLFKRYGFEKREFGELTAYALREENKTLKEEKDFRVIVVFRGEMPYAVVTNDQAVEAQKIKAAWEDGSYKIIYFYKPTPAQEELLQDTILYTFLGL